MVVIADVNLHDSHILPLVKWRGVWPCVGGSVAEVEKPGTNVIGRMFLKEVWHIITLATWVIASQCLYAATPRL
jgi:hypothetical protein